MTISTEKNEIPETFDINITIPESEVLAEYEKLSTIAAKQVMTIFLTQLAINSAIGMVIKTANQMMPGGTEFNDKDQEGLNKLLDATSHMAIMELALTSVGYSAPEARMFAQSYALKARDIALVPSSPSPAPVQKKLPKEVEDVLERMSTIITQSKQPTPTVPQRPERKQNKK